MRAMLCLCLFSALPAWSLPVSAQPIGLSDLEGARINGVVVQHRVVRNAEGMTGENRTTQSYTVDVLPEGRIRTSLTVTVHRLRSGETSSRSFTSDAKLNQPSKFRDGMHVWVLDKDNLVMLRTMQEGARIVTFAFARTDKGLSCKLTAPFAREVGGGGLGSGSAIGTAHAQILSVKEVSSSCGIRKR